MTRSLQCFTILKLPQHRYFSRFSNRGRLQEGSRSENRVADVPPRKFNPFPFSYHEIVSLYIEDLTNQGYGLGRSTLKDGSKWVVFVPTVLPGETVTCRIYRNYNSYSEADLVSVDIASPERIEPLCPYFTSCGGCQYQHASIVLQRNWKQKQVHDLLERIGGFDNSTYSVNPTAGTDQLFGYRSKLTPHYDPPPTPDKLKIGFQQRGSRITVDIDQCIIASPAINAKLTTVRQQTQQRMTTNKPKKSVTLLFREADGGYVTNSNNEVITQTVCDIKFQFKAGEFFQNNPYVMPLMVKHVIKHAYGNGDCRNLVDTYCGSGLFSLCAASQFESVYGVELSHLAIEAAKNNANLNNIKNADYLCGSAEAIFSKIGHLKPRETVIVIDPPRKGCDELFLNQLFTFRPKRLVYVSCDPSTQARDAKAIVAVGYSIGDCTPFDLFPQTRHIENIMTFHLSE
jgi:tRNA/tmRNA/rRNA uracil-C5-methylase (TrmA/RlmC/RlmD family)